MAIDPILDDLLATTVTTDRRRVLTRTADHVRDLRDRVATLETALAELAEGGHSPVYVIKRANRALAASQGDDDGDPVR